MNYLQVLNDSYKECSEEINCIDSKAEFLASYIFDLTTYDSEMDEMFVRMIMETIKAIHFRKTFEYIQDREKYICYITCVNLPWFQDKINWGTSIRGAWWEHFSTGEFGSTTEIGDGMLYVDGEYTTIVIDSNAEWNMFIDDLIEFTKNM